MSKAIDLIWDYQAAEKSIELAEKMMGEARAKKIAIMESIIKNKPLMDALQGPGIICNDALLSIEGVNSVVIEMRPVPIYSHTFEDKPESGDV